MTFAERLQALMRERDLGPVALGRQVPCDPGYVSRVASGKQPPSRRLARRLDEILDAGGTLAMGDDGPLGGHPAVWRAPSEPAPDAEALRENSQMLVRLESRIGGDDVLPAAVRAFRSAQASLGALRASRSATRDVLAAAGELGEVAGWIAYDAERPGLSRALARDALALTRSAGDREMELFLISHMTMLDIGTGDAGRALDAASMVLGQPRLAPRVEAVFKLRRGRALAALGDPRGLRELAHSASLIDDGAGARDPAWTWWADTAEIAWHQGVALGDLGDWRAAVPAFERTLAQRTSSRLRARYNDAAWLLGAYAHAGAWGDAEELAAYLAAAGDGIASTRTTVVIERAARCMIDAGPAAAREAGRLLCG
jgi:hypothetical protein